MKKKISLSDKGLSKDQIFSQMNQAKEKDVKWKDGKVWCLVFSAGDEIADLIKEAYTMFFSENGLNPNAFPSLRKFENEVVSMTASILGGDENVTGTMTSGGTESILMAVKTAREHFIAKNPKAKKMEMIIPRTAHPAFDKAGHYFGIKVIHCDLTDDFRVDVKKMEDLINSNTILLVGSAPSYPHGVVDPIQKIAKLALEHNILLHVDACVGGMLLPFAKKLDYDIPNFDFQVDGVTSMSVDLHKYGYAAKGASVVLYKNKELRRKQFFVYTEWPGGIYASPSMGGTRPGGAIAAAWAVMNYLGEEGYLKIVKVVMETAKKIIKGVNAVDDIHIVSNPDASILAIASNTLDVFVLGDEMAQYGWYMDRQQEPPSLHLTITHAHSKVADKFLEDLKESVKKTKKFTMSKLSDKVKVSLVKGAVKVLPEAMVSKLTAKSSKFLSGKGEVVPKRSAAMYGMMGSLPNKGDVNEMILDFMDNLYEQP
ncbi:MAG: aspartate aminotransferase family protein [Cyanobacteriota bacterium]